MNKQKRIEMGERIKKYRNILSLTQEQASELLGIAYSSYTKIENGFQSPSLDLLIKIASLYSVKLDYLVHGDDEVKPDKAVQIAGIIKSLDKDKLKYVNTVISKLIDFI